MKLNDIDFNKLSDKAFDTISAVWMVLIDDEKCSS